MATAAYSSFRYACDEWKPYAMSWCNHATEDGGDAQLAIGSMIPDRENHVRRARVLPTASYNATWRQIEIVRLSPHALHAEASKRPAADAVRAMDQQAHTLPPCKLKWSPSNVTRTLGTRVKGANGWRV